jgi:thiol-disulfide isomerase/thioredoxin
MTKKIFILFLSVLATAGQLRAQKAPLISLTDLLALTKKGDNTIQIFNFWATWCGPCIKEMPLLEAYQAEHPEVTVYLVSLDMDLDPQPEKVHKFVERKKIRSRVLILNERNPNDWIEKIERSWTGAIPATLVINTATGKRKFIEKEMHEGDLEALVASVQ